MSRKVPTDGLEQLIGKKVVLDAASPFVFIGTLTGVDPKYIILEDADAHDLRDTQTTRELYVLQAKRLGVRANRHRVIVRLDDVISVSQLDDVIE